MGTIDTKWKTRYSPLNIKDAGIINTGNRSYMMDYN